MMATCLICGTHYDDARRSTVCPHKNILPPHLMDQKIAALALATTGRKVVVIDDPDETPRHIVVVGWSGLITLEGRTTDEFRPEQLRLVDETPEEGA